MKGTVSLTTIKRWVLSKVLLRGPLGLAWPCSQHTAELAHWRDGFSTLPCQWKGYSFLVQVSFCGSRLSCELDHSGGKILSTQDGRTTEFPNKDKNWSWNS